MFWAARGHRPAMAGILKAMGYECQELGRQCLEQGRGRARLKRRYLDKGVKVCPILGCKFDV